MCRLQAIITCLLVVLLAACSSTPVNAPVAARSSQPADKYTPASRGAAAGKSSHYVVKRGDTLYSIAWQHGLGYRELAAMNGIRAPYTIYAGQRLKVRPAGARQAPTKATTRPATTAATPRPAPVTKPAKTTRPVKSAPAPAAKDSAAVPAYNGQWVWPTRGRLLSGFSPGGPGKKGIDIGGHSGQPVKAAASGKVVYVGSGLVGYGRLIIIKHNESLLSAYGHNSKLLVEEGAHVQAGQLIAKMGSSGTNRTGLYFEIRKDGKPVNPLHYLPES